MSLKTHLGEGDFYLGVRSSRMPQTCWGSRLVITAQQSCSIDVGGTNGSLSERDAMSKTIGCGSARAFRGNFARAETFHQPRADLGRALG